jgi:aspartate carbamoyltransferase regulatory subunit
MEEPRLVNAVRGYHVVTKNNVQKMQSSLSVYWQRCSSKTCISSKITTVILSFDWQWYFCRVNMSRHCQPMVQVSFFVGLSSIY